MSEEEFEKLESLESWSQIKEKFDSADSKEEMLGLVHTMCRTPLPDEEKVERASYYLKVAEDYPEPEVRFKARQDLLGEILDYPNHGSTPALRKSWWVDQSKAWSFIKELLDYLDSESNGNLEALVKKEPFLSNLKELLGDLYSSARAMQMGSSPPNLEGSVNKWNDEVRKELVHDFPLIIRVMVKFRLYSEWMIYSNHPIFLDVMKKELFGHLEDYSKKDLKKAVLERDPSFVRDFLEMEKNLAKSEEQESKRGD
ncbi:MAG: hypothetical protein V5A57_01805 [Candidatus Paceibacterota bacterium]